jgi:hypothetical protein
MHMRGMAATAAFVLLAGCTLGTQSEDATVTQRQAVSPFDVSLESLTELGVGVPSCGGDPVVDELEEDAEQVRLPIVTTVVVSGDSDDCADGLLVTLDAPLDDRSVIDLVSGETLTVVELDAEPDPQSRQTERRPVSLAGAAVHLVEPRELVLYVQSCDGDPAVDAFGETDTRINIQVVTTVVTSGDSDDCLDSVIVTLTEPLGDRDVIDLMSGETLTATPEDRSVDTDG